MKHFAIVALLELYHSGVNPIKVRILLLCLPMVCLHLQIKRLITIKLRCEKASKVCNNAVGVRNKIVSL